MKEGMNSKQRGVLVVAVERDEMLAEGLRENWSGAENLHLHVGDARSLGQHIAQARPGIFDLHLFSHAADARLPAGWSWHHSLLGAQDLRTAWMSV